ncbi:MAG TPA: SDR family NAD(P)-dependent oxidoreductase, partial [Pseudonocardiaceae bacterium]|nr:SDR family NAD(P)-dependent oxidoreductase [Pseudonocardiaceae bacterium]
MTRAPTTVVTGAGRGIGRAIALRLAADGRPLGLIDIETDDLVRTADLVRANGSDAATVAGDVTRGGDVDRLCTEVESRFGPVEDLVNNAG